MADLLFLFITVAFFAIAVGFVRICDKVIGPDSEFGELTDGGEPDDEDVGPPVKVPTPAAVAAGAVR